MARTKETNCTKCFGNLGVGSRMMIYNYLKNKGKATVNEIVDIMGVTQPTVSYHLKEMRESGLLKNEKKGKKVFYQINPKCPHDDKDCVLNKIALS